MNDNKLKELMNKEIKRAVNKYNSAVFILNGGSCAKATELYGFKESNKTLKNMCKQANESEYKKLVEQDKNKMVWVKINGDVVIYFNDVGLCDLRKNKHLFIGDAE